MVWFLAAAAAVSVASSFLSSRKQKKAGQRAAAAAEQRALSRQEQARLEKLKLQRQRRAVAREARLARGAALQAGASSGAGLGSSGIQGGIGGAESVAAASQAYLSEGEKGIDRITAFENAAGDYDASAQKNANAAGTISSIGGAFSSAIGSFAR